MAEPTLYLFDGYNLLHAGPFTDQRELTDTLASFVAGRARAACSSSTASGRTRRTARSRCATPRTPTRCSSGSPPSTAGTEEVCLVSSDFAVRGTSGQEVQKRSSRSFVGDLELPRHSESHGSRLGDALDAETRARLERLRRGDA